MVECLLTAVYQVDTRLPIPIEYIILADINDCMRPLMFLFPAAEVVWSCEGGEAKATQVSRRQLHVSGL